MRRALLIPLTLVTAAAFTVYLLVPWLRPDDPVWRRALLSAFALIVALLLRGYLNEWLVDQTDAPPTRYVVHKIIGAFTIAGALAALALIWIEDPRTLGVSLGVVGAGLAVALQNPITSVFSLFVILTHGLFHVGDRIQVKGTVGDVIDIHAFHTKIMEVGEWMEGESWTGRIVSVPNHLFLENEIANYTRDFPFLWDTVKVPVTLSSNWEKAERIIGEAAAHKTAHLEDDAKAQIGHMSQHYLVPAVRTETRTFVKPTDDWIEIVARFVTTPRGRKGMKSRILTEVLQRLEREPDVEIASERLRLQQRENEGYRAGRGGAPG